VTKWEEARSVEHLRKEKRRRDALPHAEFICTVRAPDTLLYNGALICGQSSSRSGRCCKNEVSDILITLRVLVVKHGVEGAELYPNDSMCQILCVSEHKLLSCIIIANPNTCWWCG
jgi:hypothetical protein